MTKAVSESPRESWLTLREIKEAGFRSPEEAERGGTPSLSDVGGQVVKFTDRMAHRILDTMVNTGHQKAEAPVFDKWDETFDRNRTALLERARELVNNTLVRMADDPLAIEVNVEAVMKMVEDGYLVSPGKNAEKTWAHDDLRAATDAPPKTRRR